MYRRLKIPIPIPESGCSTPRDQGQKRFQIELEKEIGGKFEKDFEKEIKNEFEIKISKKGHGSKKQNAKSSVAFIFNFDDHTFYNPPQETISCWRDAVFRKGVMR